MSLFILMISVSFSFAQVKFYAKGNAQAEVGEYYQISFVLENASGTNFTPPSFDGFSIGGGPMQSNRTTVVNGNVSSSLTITYYLIAQDTGVLDIDPAKIRVDNKALVTESITVEVIANPDNPSSSSNNNTDDDGDAWKDEAAKRIFLRLYTDNTTPYVGEQVTVYAKLYQSLDAYNTYIQEMPEFEGFWKQEMDVSNADWEYEEYNGSRYNTLLAGKFALFPQKDGELTISPYEMYTELQVYKSSRRDDIWSQFFQESEWVEYIFKSNSLTIDVQNLPLENQPENYSGAVGDFTFETDIDSTTIQLGSAIDFETEIKGAGNIMMIEMPALDFPSDIEVYDPETQEFISEKSTYVNGTKRYNYILVPELPGEYVLPNIAFSYFNPLDEEYHTIESPNTTIIVEGEMPQAYIDSLASEEELVAEDELYTIFLDNDLKGKAGDSFYGTTPFYALLGATPLLSLLFVFVGRKVRDKEVDIVALKNKKAQKMAEKRLKKAALHKKDASVKPFYDEIIRTLLDYSADKMNIDGAHLSKENIGRKLSTFGVSNDKIETLKSLIETCELALFANAKSNTMNEDFQIAKQIIIDIENELND
ncbi:MAG: BatD family protein [Chitinophagales bacterium]